MHNNKNIFIFATIFFLYVCTFLSALTAYKSNSESQTQYKNEAISEKDYKISSDEEKIKQSGYSYIYSKSKNKWREYKLNLILASDDVLVSKGDKGKCFMLYFSSYRHKYSNQKLLLDNVSTFIENGKLYTFDYSNLKMNEIIATGNKFNNTRVQ